MGTEVSVYLWHDDPRRGEEAVEAVFAEMDRINALMSTYVEESTISEVNRDAAAGWVDAGQELHDLVVRSLDISVLTRGAFDITYDSVGQHYDFREGKRPDAETIDDALDTIDYTLVETNAGATSIHFTREGVRINLGGIAKGYVVERGVEILKARGVTPPKSDQAYKDEWLEIQFICLDGHTHDYEGPRHLFRYRYVATTISETITTPPAGRMDPPETDYMEPIYGHAEAENDTPFMTVP